MAYQRGSGTPREFDRPKKTRVKQKIKTRITTSRRGEIDARSGNEIVALTLAGLDTLGAQTFAMAPFHQHFKSWLRSLQTVIEDFETSPVIEVDERFKVERAELFSAVVLALTAEQAKEESREARILSLRSSKDMLLHHDQEHAEKLREQSARRDSMLKTLISKVEPLRGELDMVVESKAGLFEGITKRKAKMELDARARLAIAERELENAKTSFTEELNELQNEYEGGRQTILEKVAADRREIDSLEAEAEIDGSADVRRVACEELTESVNTLLKRIIA